MVREEGREGEGEREKEGEGERRGEERGERGRAGEIIPFFPSLFSSPVVLAVSCVYTVAITYVNCFSFSQRCWFLLVLQNQMAVLKMISLYSDYIIVYINSACKCIKLYIRLLLCMACEQVFQNYRKAGFFHGPIFSRIANGSEFREKYFRD